MEMRIVLLGKSGSGKSATGNTILGEKFFLSSLSGSSVTSECSEKHSFRFEHKFVIVDTPGSFDTKHDNKKTQQEILKCVALTSPGPHAFILVLSLTRFTEEEQRSVEHFVQYFGEDIYKYFIVLFTRKDDLDREGIDIMKHIKTVPDNLKTFLSKCGRRVIAFNNTLHGKEQEEQVKELLSMILENIKKNDGNYYTNEMYAEAEALVKKREDEIIKKTRKEQEKQLKQFEKQYESRFAEQRKQHQITQQQLEALMQRKKDEEMEVDNLKKQIRKYEEQIQCSGDKKNDRIPQLEKMQRDIDLKKEMAEKEKREIEKLEKIREEEKRQASELLEKREKERKLELQKMQEKIESTERNVRNVVRNEVEKESNFFSRAWGYVTSFFS